MKTKISLLTITILAIPALFYLFGPGYFNMHDDLQVMRIFQMEKCFADGQIPCRWAPDMAYGYGQAMFNYYSVFPYYLGVFIRMIAPLSIMGSVKVLFIISLLGSAVGMYLLVKEIWGNTAGVVGAILYLYAPYHALDVYIRGALSESFALMILPFLWWGFYKLIKQTSFKWVALTSIFLAMLLTSHNISTMLYAPITIAWTVYWVIKERNWKSIYYILTAGVLGVGLSSFFTLPLVFEKQLIQTKFLTMDYLDYNAHFVTIRQLFLDRSWGHGPSIWGPEDEISFQIGWPHWWIAVIVGVLLIVKLYKKKFSGEEILVGSVLALGGFTTYLTHLRSNFIWLAIPTLSFVQFPWRFLGLSIFFLSFAGAYLFRKEVTLRWLIAPSVILLIIILNFGYFKPWNRSYDYTDEQKLSGEAFLLQQKSAILDYLPKTAPVAPKEVAPNKPWILEGEGETKNYFVRSNSFFFDVEAFTPVKVQVPVMYFPGWIVLSGGSLVSSGPEGDYGVITFNLPEGKHIIKGRFTNTPIRSLGNTVSIIAASLLFVGYFVSKRDIKLIA